MEKFFIAVIIVMVLVFGYVLTWQINPLLPAVKFCQNKGYDALAYEIDNWTVCKNFVKSCKGDYCKTTEEFFTFVF